MVFDWSKFRDGRIELRGSSHETLFTSTMAASRQLLSVDFEVFGKVQGVFFRKHTQKNASSLGLVGWVQNTPTGTVVGQVQGPSEKIAQMKTWLSTKGSPKSQIKKCDFKDEKSITRLTFSGFTIKK